MEKEKVVLEDIRRQMETLPGHLGFYYKNLVTGLTYGVREEEAFLAASVIKFPLYLHILAQAEKGQLSLEGKLTVRPRDKMPSCGALNQFPGEVQADIATLCRLMIVISDNTATNVLIDRCGIGAVNEGFRRMGLEKTVLRRKLFDSEASARGLENTVSPREMGMLLETLYRERYVNQETSRTALSTLLDQQIDHKLDGKLCGRVPIAHKTGEDDRLSNDVGIVYAKEPFVICFTGHDTDVYLWEDLIRRSAYALWEIQGP